MPLLGLNPLPSQSCSSTWVITCFLHQIQTGAAAGSSLLKPTQGRPGKWGRQVYLGPARNYSTTHGGFHHTRRHTLVVKPRVERYT